MCFRHNEVGILTFKKSYKLFSFLGILALTGSTEFFIRKFTSSEIDFAACGFVTHVAAWMMLVAGCCGICHGYDYTHGFELDENTVHSINIRPTIFDNEPRDYDPLNYARGKWKKMQFGNVQSVSAGLPK